MEFSTITINTIETGKRITQARNRAGLSVRDVQTALGLEAPNAIYRWQRGECLPRLDHLVILASILKMPLDDLVAVEGGTYERRDSIIDLLLDSTDS